MTDVTPSPTSSTLLLKNGKTTVFVAVLPTTPLHSLKTELLRLLREHETHLDGLAEVVPDHADADDVILGATIDPSGHDVARGFHIIDGQDKKKTTIQDVGLRDGCVVSWRICEDRFLVEVPNEEGGD